MSRVSKDDETAATDPTQIELLIERLKHSNLSSADAQLIERLLRLLLSLLSLVQQKNLSISRLKRLLFGPRSDTRTPSQKHPQSESDGSSTAHISPSTAAEEKASVQEPQPRRRGHGRLSASDYHAAKVVKCTDAELHPGMSCPDQLCSGRLYDTHSPHLFIRLTGQPLIAATRFEQQALRCSRCQHRFIAPLPEAVTPQKYDPTADVAIAFSRYGAGLPFYRLARMQRVWGVPVPESVQFERCERVADALLPVFLHLCRQAAQCQTIYADDTRVKILSLMKENEGLSEGERRGMQTTGIVAQVGECRIVLYHSGRRHAGENIEELLRLRPQALSPPIQMGDALSNNWTGEFQRIVAKCLAHARRQFSDLEAAFPSECKLVLDALSKVYKIEAATHAMTAEERLRYHQHHSGPVMQDLHDWMGKQFAERAVEPNSALGRAIRYMQTHWEGLTKFLSEKDAPLDNNLVERVLKRAVLVRKNSLFYRSLHGAAIGDLILSLIETCQQNNVSAWDYLLAVMRNERLVRKNPAQWLPWNYPCEELKKHAA